MKNKLIISIAYVLAVILTIGCIPNSIQPNPLSGKLKSIQFSDGVTIFGTYFYNYDSITGIFENIHVDSISNRISVNKYTNRLEIRSTHSTEISTILINSLGFADSLFTSDSSINKLLFSSKFLYDGNNLNQISISNPNGLIYTIKHRDFEYENMNNIKYITEWSPSPPSGTISINTDTLLLEYYSEYVNSQYVPFQYPILNQTYFLGGTLFDNIIFGSIMEMLDYAIIMKNSNLIKSIRSTNLGFVTNFTYSFNTTGKVSEITISNPDGTGILFKYKLEYY